MRARLRIFPPTDQEGRSFQSHVLSHNTAVSQMEQSKAVAAEATRRVEERNGTSTCTMLENGIIGKNAMGHRPDVAQVEIGSRVAVFWPQDNLYYEATVTQIRDKTRLWHLLDYDDGRSEWTELDQCKFRVLPEGIRHRTDDEIQDNYYDSFELESQAPADDEYQNENYGRREGKPNGDGVDASSFRRVLQGTNKRHGGHGIQGKQNVPSNTTSLETDPSKSAAGTQDKEARKDNAAINMELVLPQPSLFSTPSADLDQVAAFVERFVERAIQSSSGTNFNSSSEKATKTRSGKRRSSSIAKVTTKSTTGKKLKYSTEKATKETPGERKRNSSIEKATVGKKRKSSHENAPKETPGTTRTHPIEKAAMKTGGKMLKETTRETPLKKHSFSIGTKVRKVSISVICTIDSQHDITVNSRSTLVL